MRKNAFQPIDPTSHDENIYIREFTGMMTPRREEIIKQWCEKKSWRQSCHHEWDCCGCLFAEYFEYEYKQNQVTITYSQHFNY